MRSSISFVRGSVVLVNVRFSDDSGIKRRPAVIVSVDSFHESRADALIVPLTSRLSTLRFGDYLLQDWDAAGLPRASMAKGLMETVERATFGPMLGTLTPRDLAGIEHSMRNILGI